MGSYHLVDMHCHLDFMANADAVAHDAAAKGLAIFANTVTPQGFEAAHATLAGASNVRVGVGLHPWWVADGRASWRDVERATERARAARWVGEVGLDFSPAHVPAESEKLQVDALRLVAQACAEGAEATGPKLLSIHAVRSAQTVLDVLEETGCLSSCHCIFHWFSGRSDELHRAVIGHRADASMPGRSPWHSCSPRRTCRPTRASRSPSRRSSPRSSARSTR